MLPAIKPAVINPASTDTTGSPMPAADMAGTITATTNAITDREGIWMRSEEEINKAIDRYSDMVKRICFCHLKNEADTEDIFQNVFLKYLLYDGIFENAEHEKAWFIRVTINACKDFLKSLLRHRTLPLDVLAKETVDFHSGHCDILHAVLSLPPKYRDVIYLHYYEGYTAAEIAKILKARENTIYSHLSRGRSMLKKKLEEENYVE